MNKILFVVTNADLAGAPLHVLELVRSIDCSKFSCEIVFGEDGPIKKTLEELGFTTHIVPTMRSNINPPADFKSLIGLLRIIRNSRPNLIHCHSSKAGMVGRLAAFLSGVKVIYTIHGWGFGLGRKSSVSAFVYSVEYLLKWLTDHFISVSDADRIIGIDSVSIPHFKITTVHNGVRSLGGDSSHFERIPKRVIMVARNDFQKDYMTLCRALAITDFDEAFFVGRGTDEPSFVQQAGVVLGESVSRVSFLGVRSDVPNLLSRSSVFVLSSRFEGLPLSIIEAMAQSLPIISSDVGGCSELVRHGYNGFLFRSGDHYALASYVKNLLASPGMCLEFGNNSKKLYENYFSNTVMAEKTMRVYEDVLGVSQ